VVLEGGLEALDRVASDGVGLDVVVEKIGDLAVGSPGDLRLPLDQLQVRLLGARDSTRTSTPVAM
jgi:hypothetical protein